MRASNTQPVLVMRFEAGCESRLKEIQKLVENVPRIAGQFPMFWVVIMAGGMALVSTGKPEQ